MKRLIVGMAAVAACSGWASAHSAGRLAEVAIVDRDSGVRLQAYYHRGEYWVAGEPGARYAILITNRLGERLLAVTSVDGINVVTGQTAGWDQSGYVFDPGEQYQITGWRKSEAEVAAFAFTTPPASYAERTGRPQNLGVIGLALFREQPVAYVPPPRSPPIARNESREREATPMGSAAAKAQASSAPAEGMAAEGSAADAQVTNRPFQPAQSALPPALGTAHGEREYSYASHTTFVRRQSHPDEIVRIRYDSMEHLIALGIVRPPRQPFTHPDPFPGSGAYGYVPDPPGF